MRKRMKEILRDRRASSFPMTIGIVLSLIILMCGISEYFRLQVIAAGVREAVEDAVISTVNDNYAGVYHGVREGYSGSYVPFGEGSWEEDLNEGDIYDYLDESKLFKGTVVPKDRSLMNVPFVTGDKDLDAKFVKEAKKAGFENLKGHRSVGGMRASIYNAMPIEGVEKLVEFMKAFEKENL